MFEQLTNYQKKIIDLQGKNILKACPGSGKTFVIAHKVVYDFRLWKDKNKGMAILSFTNVAKNELHAKIQEISGLKTLPYPHFIGTLDAFISQYIFMPFGQVLMQCSSRPSIIEDDFIEYYSKYFWKRECYANGCDPKSFYIDTQGVVYDSKKDFKDCPLKNNEPCVKFKISTYSKGYATYKETLIIAIDLLKKCPKILRLIINRFPYFIVDEAQDTSEEQMKLLNLLFNNGVKTAVLIGDPDQAIYEWRDADPSVFLNMYNSEGWNAKELNENFRCSQHICNATKIFSSLSEISVAQGESKDSLIKPIIIKYNKSEKNVIIEKFIELCRENKISISPEKVAILSRGRSGLVGKDYSKINDLWQTPITKLFAQATYNKSLSNVVKTVSIVEKILYYIIFNNQTNDADYKDVQQKYSIKEWNLLVFKLSILLPDATLSLKSWKELMESVIEKFIKDNNIICNNEVCIKTKSRVNNSDLKDFLDQPVEVFFSDAYEKDYLSATIHAVKGCTFDAAMLIVGTNGKLTSNMINQKEIDTEEIRTFYVAATRSKKLFVLAIPNTIKDKSLVRFPKEHWNYI